MTISQSQLRAFHAVATEGSFTKAANSLNVTSRLSPARSGRWKNGTACGCSNRRRRKIEVTDIGRQLLEIAWRLFSLEIEAEQVLTAAKGLKRGHLRIGADAPYHSIPFLAVFNRRYPNLRLSMSIGNPTSCNPICSTRVATSPSPPTSIPIRVSMPFPSARTS